MDTGKLLYVKRFPPAALPYRLGLAAPGVRIPFFLQSKYPPVETNRLVVNREFCVHVHHDHGRRRYKGRPAHHHYWIVRRVGAEPGCEEESYSHLNTVEKHGYKQKAKN